MGISFNASILKKITGVVCLIIFSFYILKWWNEVPRFPEQLIYSPEKYKNKNKFRFFILGDTGSGDRNQYAVASAMDAKCRSLKPDGIILLGDNFYQSGVNSKSDPQWQEKLFIPYSMGCLKEVPIYPVLGNHDFKGDIKSQLYPKNKNPKWFLPHRFYEVSFGSFINFIAIDTNVFDVCFQRERCTIDFLKSRLNQNSDSSWKIVFGHHPIKSSSKKYTSYKPVGRILKWLLCNKSTAYLSGHSHHLEHTEFADCNLQQFVSGGGGASLYDVFPNKKNSHFSKSSHGYLILDAEPKKLNWEFYNENNESLYSYEQVKP